MKIKLNSNDRVILRSVLISRKCELKEYMRLEEVFNDDMREEFDRVCGLASLLTTDCNITIEYK